MQHNTWLENDTFANWTVHKRTTACRWSVQSLAFNFESRTFAFLSLAQGLNRSLSAFNSTVREYLDPLVTVDKCAQYVDDIGIAANTVELVNNVEAVFKKIRQAF